MTLNLTIALMIAIISFVVYYSIFLKLRREGTINPPSKLKKQITNVLFGTNFGIGGIIILIIIGAGWDPIIQNQIIIEQEIIEENIIIDKESTIQKDIAGWVSLVVSSGIGLGAAISIALYTISSQRKTDKLTGEIHEYIKQQKKKDKFIQTDYAKQILSLINFARMKIHGMKVQIKILKGITSEPWSPKRLEHEAERREMVRKYQKELQELMVNASIKREVMIQVFDEDIELLYNKMWKMFAWNDSLLNMGEDFFESFMDMIDTGVEATEELHNILIEYVAERERKGYAMRPVNFSK